MGNSRRQPDDSLIGYGAGEFFEDFFTGGVLAPLRLAQIAKDRPVEQRPTDVVRDYKATAAYKAALDRAAATDARGASAQQARAEAVQALAAVRSAPGNAAPPIAVNVPSFLLGGSSEPRGHLELLGAERVGFDFMQLAKGAAGALQNAGGLISKSAESKGKGDDAEKKKLEEERRKAEESATRLRMGLTVGGVGVGLAALLALLLGGRR